MDYRSLTGVLFLTGVPSRDACVFLSFDDLRKNGAPGDRSRDVVVGCPLPEPTAGLTSRLLFSSRELFDRSRSCGVLESRTTSEMTYL
jgi:hypothetical protein